MRRGAVIAGVDHYRRTSLTGCVADANRMEKLLSEHGDDERSLNYECVVLRGENPNKCPDRRASTVNRLQLLGQLEQLFANERLDSALFYFAGHGAPSPLGTWLLCSDSDLDQKYDGVALSHVLQLANQSKIPEVTVILDCCYSGSGGESIDAGGKVVLRENVSLLSASSNDQVAVETSDGGAFTRLVCDALEGAAADIRGRITLASIYAYVDQIFGAFEQRPTYKGSVTSLAPVRKVKPAIPLGRLRELLEYFESEDAVYPVDPSYDPELEPKGHPNEAIMDGFRDMLRQRLLIPHEAEHLYYAARDSKGCRLTPLGRFCWRLAKRRRLAG